MRAEEINKMDEREAMQDCCQLAFGWYIPGEDYGAELRRYIQQEKKWVTIETCDPRKEEFFGEPPYQAQIKKRYANQTFEVEYDALGWFGLGDTANVALYRAFLKAWHEAYDFAEMVE